MQHNVTGVLVNIVVLGHSLVMHPCTTPVYDRQFSFMVSAQNLIYLLASPITKVSLYQPSCGVMLVKSWYYWQVQESLANAR